MSYDTNGNKRKSRTSRGREGTALMLKQNLEMRSNRSVSLPSMVRGDPNAGKNPTTAQHAHDKEGMNHSEAARPKQHY